jgi:hypothetical protein
MSYEVKRGNASRSLPVNLGENPGPWPKEMYTR